MTAWTLNEIKDLSTYYTKGYPIKEISKILKRSPTALHKAISRFKLHPLRCKKTKEDVVADNGLPVASYKQRQQKFYIKRLFQRCMNEEWVQFEDVLSYLKNKGVDVGLLKQKNEEGEELFALNRKIFVGAQVLLVANRLRVDEKKSPFKVERLCL